MTHVLHPGDVVCVERGERVETLLGSCVAVVLTDARRSIAAVCSTASSATSSTSSSCTCMISRAGRRRAVHSCSTRSMASFTMSAAVPCMGALMALRSAYCCMLRLRERISGR